MSMAKSLPTLLPILLILCLLWSPLSTSAKSRRPISDNEIRDKKNTCYSDIESGLWGWQCKSSIIAKENCALRCLSPACYELIYESDPLEEGEKDYIRGQEYKYCMHKLSLGESLEGIKGTFDYRISMDKQDETYSVMVTSDLFPSILVWIGFSVASAQSL